MAVVFDSPKPNGRQCLTCWGRVLTVFGRMGTEGRQCLARRYGGGGSGDWQAEDVKCCALTGRGQGVEVWQAKDDRSAIGNIPLTGRVSVVVMPRVAGLGV